MNLLEDRPCLRGGSRLLARTRDCPQAEPPVFHIGGGDAGHSAGHDDDAPRTGQRPVWLHARAAFGQAIGEFPLRFQVPADVRVAQGRRPSRTPTCMPTVAGRWTKDDRQRQNRPADGAPRRRTFSKASVKGTAKTYAKSFPLAVEKRLYDYKDDQKRATGGRISVNLVACRLRQVGVDARPFDPARGEQIMPAVTSVTASGDQDIDGMLYNQKWAVNSFTFSFPTSASFYQAGSAPNGETTSQLRRTEFHAAETTCGISPSRSSRRWRTSRSPR